uniref:Uncharacterized protein n=1 Tax=Ciona savignyi TaxID=51511 RepID=H2ZLL6_CIOSA
RLPGEPPLVSHWIPFVGAALDIGKAPLDYMRSLQRRLGDVFTIKLAGWDVHVFMNPLDVPSLERAKSIDHTQVIGQFVSQMVGDKHLIHNPAKHSEVIPKTLEKTLRSAMHLITLCDSCTSILPKTIERTLKSEFSSKRKMKIGLYKLCKKLVADMTLNLFFGSLASDKDCSEETRKICEEFFVYFDSSALLVDRIPIHLLPATKRSRNKMFELLSDFDFENRENVSKLISQVAAVGKSHNPENSTNEERVRHLLIILWSAQANTLPALFWTLFHILNDKQAKVDVLQEFEKHLGKSENFYDVTTVGENLQWPTMDDIQRIKKGDLDKMVVLDSCLKETLRVSGSSMAVRRATQNTTITLHSGKVYNIRKGDYTSYFAPVTHQDTQIYEKPEEYRHERFLQRGEKDPNMLKSRTQFSKEGKRISPSTSIMTFGYGAIRCPGRHIAMIEIKVLALTLLKHFNIDLGQIYDRSSKDYPQPDLTHLGFGVMPPDRDVGSFPLQLKSL